MGKGEGVATEMNPGVEDGVDGCQKNSQSDSQDDFEKIHGC